MPEPDPVAGIEATLKLLEPLVQLRPSENPDISFITTAVSKLVSAHPTGQAPTALSTKQLTAAFIGIFQLLHASYSAALKSIKKPSTLLQAAAASSQVQECKDVTEQCRAALARADAANSKLQKQLDDSARLTARWADVVRGNKNRAAQPASTQLIRITRSDFPSDLTSLTATKLASKVLTGLGLYAGAVLQALPEYPGGDRKRAAQAIVVTVSAATFTYVFAPEQRQALQSLTASGTRVCRHLSPIEHACRKALYSKYTTLHPAVAEAGPAEGRARLPPHRFSDDYTAVTFHPRAAKEDQVLLRLSKEEVEAFRTKPGKGPARTQA